MSALREAVEDFCRVSDQNERLRADLLSLRKNFARYLAAEYRRSPARVATLCDETLDRSGELLGYVREFAQATDTSAKPTE